ncbi:hypothetical protein CesoFtcFv8_008307 [Champsocephalus esox]|uniref:Uncharacterized protein n=1 Tax=Champsocephalus esox TaxID=159716 RepID=A0AAN8H177_9TELE|nr:hypothetical protein CesoFtcFv8_008307 [Champsocephalus esox]
MLGKHCCRPLSVDSVDSAERTQVHLRQNLLCVSDVLPHCIALQEARGQGVEGEDLDHEKATVSSDGPTGLLCTDRTEYLHPVTRVPPGGTE